MKLIHALAILIGCVVLFLANPAKAANVTFTYNADGTQGPTGGPLGAGDTVKVVNNTANPIPVVVTDPAGNVILSATIPANGGSATSLPAQLPKRQTSGNVSVCETVDGGASICANIPEVSTVATPALPPIGVLFMALGLMLVGYKLVSRRASWVGGN